MQNNHLIEPIKTILDNSNGPISEYELIQALQKQEWLDPVTSGDTLALYAAHFLVYNALFQLLPRYQAVGESLLISATAIQRIQSQENATGSYLQENTENQAHMEKLKDYYLDLAQLEEATQESVDALITSFWERYVSQDDYTAALAELGIVIESTNNITLTEVKKRYRKLAMEHHPDRGGDEKRFQRIQQAFATLQRAL